jgi:pyridoxal phosphate enzyme (YggS family)
VGVSKTFPASAVAEAVAAGLRDCGENRVQEAAVKIAEAAKLGVRPTWHLVGTLQRNKVRAALPLFDMIHSVDSIALIEEIGRRAHEPVAVLLEVNVGGETSKHGFVSGDLPDALAEARRYPLDVRGLMTVAPQGGPHVARPCFQELARLAREMGLPELSMGMSDDFETAIEEGATMVRIGRAIFGERTVQ